MNAYNILKPRVDRRIQKRKTNVAEAKKVLLCVRDSIRTFELNCHPFLRTERGVEQCIAGGNCAALYL